MSHVRDRSLLKTIQMVSEAAFSPFNGSRPDAAREGLALLAETIDRCLGPSARLSAAAKARMVVAILCDNRALLNALRPLVTRRPTDGPRGPWRRLMTSNLSIVAALIKQALELTVPEESGPFWI